MNKRLLISLTAAMVTGFSTASLAWLEAGGERDEALTLTPDRERGIEVYEVCAGCHRLEGWGETSGTFPQLAGQHKEVLIKQLADIREGNRDNPTMYPFALDDQILGPPSMKRERSSLHSWWRTSRITSPSCP